MEFSLENTASQMWDELRIDFPCVLCQDVLAAPALLSCSHTFCGDCAEVKPSHLPVFTFASDIVIFTLQTGPSHKMHAM